MRQHLLALLFLAGCTEAVAQVVPIGSKPEAQAFASFPVSGGCWAVTSATAPACLTNAAGPIYIPQTAVIRVYAVAAANPFFTQAPAADLTVTANTLAITDGASVCGAAGTSVCADGFGPTFPLGAGGVDYFMMGSFMPRKAPGVLGGTDLAVVGARVGRCQTAVDPIVQGESERPCGADADCDVTGYATCDLTPEKGLPLGGFICATAPASTYVCATWF